MEYIEKRLLTDLVVGGIRVSISNRLVVSGTVDDERVRRTWNTLGSLGGRSKVLRDLLRLNHSKSFGLNSRDKLSPSLTRG